MAGFKPKINACFRSGNRADTRPIQANLVGTVRRKQMIRAISRRLGTEKLMRDATTFLHSDCANRTLFLKAANFVFA
jgi:hypothetical protein